MPEKRFRVGDKVIFRFGIRDVEGLVREDLGSIGIKGRRLYSVEFYLSSGSDELVVVDLPAEMMQHLPNETAAT